MNYFPYFLFLASITCLSFVLFILFHMLDFATVTHRQKMMFLKIGFTVILLTLFILILLRLFSWQPMSITLLDKFNPLSIHAAYTSFNERKMDWTLYILAAYCAGLFVMLSRILFSYLSAKKQLISSFPTIIQGQAVLLNKQIQSPLCFGLFKTTIYFPLDFEKKWTFREIQMSLAHEKIHLQQNDYLWKLFSHIIQAILFFVPWSYSLHRRFELEMEIVCDERACVETKASIQEYGNMLLAIASLQPQNLIFTHLTDSTLKRRLLAMKSKTIRRPLLMTIFSVALLLAGGAAIATSTGIVKEKSIFDITSKLFIDGNMVSAPRIIAYSNQKATIFLSNNGADSLRLTLIARGTIENAIEINYDIQYMNGNEKIHINPQMVVLSNQEGTIRIADSGHVYEMQVFAERKES